MPEEGTAVNTALPSAQVGVLRVEMPFGVLVPVLTSLVTGATYFSVAPLVSSVQWDTPPASLGRNSMKQHAHETNQIECHVFHASVM